MPFKKQSSKKTVSKNKETEMKKYNKTGKAGKSKPGSGKDKVVKGKKLTEAAKAKKDYDKDGRVKTPEQKFKGSRDKAIKKAKGKKTSTLKENFNNYIKDLLKKAFFN